MLGIRGMCLPKFGGERYSAVGLAVVRWAPPNVPLSPKPPSSLYIHLPNQLYTYVEESVVEPNFVPL